MNEYVKTSTNKTLFIQEKRRRWLYLYSVDFDILVSPITLQDQPCVTTSKQECAGFLVGSCNGLLSYKDGEILICNPIHSTIR
jgi:hypothetical protein